MVSLTRPLSVGRSERREKIDAFPHRFSGRGGEGMRVSNIIKAGSQLPDIRYPCSMNELVCYISVIEDVEFVGKV